MVCIKSRRRVYKKDVNMIIKWGKSNFIKNKQGKFSFPIALNAYIKHLKEVNNG